MGRPNEDWVSLAPLKGQNSSDNPLQLGPGWATTTRNVVIDPVSSLASKRLGSTEFAAPTFTYMLARHLPIGSAEANAELWAFRRDGASVLTIQRKVGGGAFGAVTVPGTLLLVTRALSFNGKLFLAGLTTNNRLHVWDGTAIRLVGLTAANAPTVANTGAGAYPATARSYRVDWIILDGTKVVARSELSANVFFTPSGAGTAARVTQPTVPASATHWRVWVAAATGTTETTVPRLLSGNIVVGTTTFDDTALVNTWTGVFRDAVGTYLAPPSVTRIITDGHRIITGGQGGPSTTATGETVPKTNRVWYTPVLGTSDQGDDERIPDTTDQKNYLDVGAPPHGDIIELDGPMDGQIFSFGKHQPWRLVPTGDLATPYLTYPVMSAVGAGEHPTFVQPASDIGETESGRPAIYFSDSAAGLYRLTANETIQFVSHDIQDEIAALASRRVIGTLVWSSSEDKQTWWHIPLENPREVRIYVFHWDLGVTGQDQAVHGGWTTWVMAETVGHILSVALHNRTPGTAGYRGEQLIPYITQCDFQVASRCFSYGRPAGTDGSTNYAASVTAAPLMPTGGQAYLRVSNPVIITTPAEATNIRVTAAKDFGAETRFADVQISPQGTATRVVRTVEGLFQGDVTALEITVGDALPTEKLWQIDLVTVPVSRQEPR